MSDQIQYDLFDLPDGTPRGAPVPAMPTTPLPAASAPLWTPDDARELYHLIVLRIRNTVVGHDAAVERLAVAAAQHVLGRGGQRFVLVGDSGVGKSTLARAVAHAMQLPFAEASLAQLAEDNWRGPQLRGVIRQLRAAALDSEPDFRRGVLLLDELDKVTVRGTSGTARDYRTGKQLSLLALLGGEPLRYGDDDDAKSWSSNQAFVICAGVFAGLRRHRCPGPEDVVRRGFTRELVERCGEFVVLNALDAAAQRDVLWRRLDDVRSSFRRFGYVLEISEAAVAYVARLVALGERGLGARSGAALLGAAAGRGLVALLNADAEPGTRYVLAPDDLEVPPPDSATRRRRG